MATAQQTPSLENARPGSTPATAAGNSIILDVVVSQSGQAIAGLQQQNFTLLDNKQPQKITSFQSLDAANPQSPTEILLLLDEVNTPFRYGSVARDQLTKFLESVPELPAPASLVFFSDAGAAATNPSRDPKILVADLKKHEQPLPNGKLSQGEFGAVERFNLSLRTLAQLADYESRRPGRKLVVWISTGWAFLSSPRIDLAAKDQDTMFASIVSLSDSLRRARITLYTVDPVGSGGLYREYYKAFSKGVTNRKQVQGGDLSLQVLAYQSGGLVLNSSNDIAGEIATCVADAKSYYALSFEAAPADGPNEYHALEVKLDKPGLLARSRVGYYAQPEPPKPH
jgi:VWFA-related protein